MSAVSLLIVEPSRLFREGLAKLLLDSPYVVMSTVRSVTDEREAFRLTPPDLIIWGPGTSSSVHTEMTWVRDNCRGTTSVRFVLLADAPSAGWLRRVVACNADAVLSQDISIQILQRSLDLVMLGQRLFPATLALASAPTESPGGFQAELIQFPVPGAHPFAPQPERRSGVVLSVREGQILHCLVNGASNKGIARDLQIAEATAKTHVKGLLRRLGVSNRTQAAVWGLNNGWQQASHTPVTRNLASQAAG